MKLILSFITVLLIAGCSTTSPSIGSETLSGKIVKEDFVNKAGRKITGVYDLFFESGNKKYFIKMAESDITQREALNVLDQPIKVKCKIKDGLWDTDDPNVQSRIGEYIVIKKILSD